MKHIFRKTSVILLVFAFIWTAVPIGVFAEGIWEIAEAWEREETVYVLAGSDFQPADDNPATGAKQVSTILRKIYDAGYTRMDGFLFAGDYDYSSVNAMESSVGKQALQEAVQAVYGTDMREVYVQGNHDPLPLLTNGILSPEGANDTESYGVFVIHEKDYMWGNDDPETIRAAANSLRSYLDKKIAENYQKPVFVVSHLPLHYSMRTYYDGDCSYANYIFDVLNEAGARGLSIIYMFGHNHSHGWDDYLGGASIYLEPGDEILIAQGSKTDFSEETLAFTYMNTGYVGCYSDMGSGVDRALTMTVFEIKGRHVLVSRYSASGLHNLKSAGNHGSQKGGDYEKNAYDANTLVYESPRLLNDYPTLTDSTGTVSVRAPGITGVTLLSKTEEKVEGYGKYVVYDFDAEGFFLGDMANVTIRAEEGYVEGLPVNVVDLKTGESRSVWIQNGAVTFQTEHMGSFAVSQIQVDAPVSDTVIIQTTSAERVSSLTPGDTYFFINADSGQVLTHRAQESGLALASSKDSYEYVWHCGAEEGRFYLMAGKQEGYLSIDESTASLANTVAYLDLTYHTASRTWRISQNGMCLSQGGSGDSAVAVGVSEDNTGEESRWLIYQVREDESRVVTAAFPFQAVTLRPGESWNPKPTVTVNGAETEEYTVQWMFSDPSVLTLTDDGLKALSEGSAMATATLISVDGKILSDRPSVTLLVGVRERRVVSATCDQDTALVPYGFSPDAPLGCSVEIFYNDGSAETVSLTASMLSGGYNLRKTGIYRGLDIMWKGEAILRSFTLVVAADDYPAYPEEGSAVFDKTVTGEEFSASGLLRVELSVSGMSAKLRGETDTEILPAVTDGICYDVLDDDFTLFKGDHRYTVMADGKAVTKTLRTSVTVLAYDLYTADDVDGVAVTADMIGTRKGTCRILETVTFNETGTEAYSDNAEGNLLKDGVLCARTFIYNSHGIGMLWDDDGNGESDIFLEANTVCWKVGTLSNTEVTLTYYAYLEDSVEGVRENGEYTISKASTLQYSNWVGNNCRAVSECPTVSWTRFTDKNGIYDDYYYVDGVRQQGPCLIRHEGQLYLIGDNDKLVRNDRARLTAELVDGFTLSDGTPLPAGTYRLDAEGRLIYPPEPETKTETEPETQPKDEREGNSPTLAVVVMGSVGILVTALATATVACLRKREKETAA